MTTITYWWAYKNRKTNQSETLEVTPINFLKRFVAHILPKGFTRVRWHGFLSCAQKRQSVNAIRDAICDQSPAISEKKLKEKKERRLFTFHVCLPRLWSVQVRSREKTPSLCSPLGSLLIRWDGNNQNQSQLTEACLYFSAKAWGMKTPGRSFLRSWSCRMRICWMCACKASMRPSGSMTMRSLLFLPS